MKSLFEGVISNQKFKIYKLNDSFIEEILSLQNVVCNALDNKEILEPLTEEEFNTILNGKGILIGAFLDQQLIAIRALYIPELNENHLGKFLGLKDEEQLKRVIYQEISFVHPEFRGYGLQKLLGKVIMNQLDKSAYDYVCATVMPYNIASLKDKFAQGFRIISLTYLYEGKLRYVFALNLHEQPQYEDGEILISMGDTIGQQKLLKEGFVGVMMKKEQDDWVIKYKKCREQGSLCKEI